MIPLESTPEPAASSESFPREIRLRLGRDFARVYAAKIRVADSFLLLFCRPNELPFSRLGLSVSKKVGIAPIRNRWKRLIREAFRKNRNGWKRSLDLIAIPQRRGELPPSQEEISRSLNALYLRAIRKIDRTGKEDQI